MSEKSADWLGGLGGRFLVLDGPDGSGNSTQLQRLIAVLGSAGLTVCEVREPGGTKIGEQIRGVLLDRENEEMDLRCEMLLYMASRAQLVEQRVRPALARGEVVVADRFISSTLAYQGAAGGLSGADISRAGQIALGDCWPDVVVVFDVDEDTAAKRIGPDRDRMEQKSLDYHRAVRGGYLEQAKNDPDRYLVIDARGDQDSVFEAMMEGLRGKVGK